MQLQEFINAKIYKKLVKGVVQSPLCRRCLTTSAPTHTVLSYIQNSGAAWLNTGIKGRSGLKVEMKIMFPGSKYTAYFFGSRQGLNSSSYILALSGSTLRSEYANASTALSATLSSSTEYTIKKLDNRQYINDVEFGSYTAGTFNSNSDMYLYAINTNGTARADLLTIRVFYLKVWDENNVLLGDFIPVTKDGVVGLFNKVTQTYHNNMSTGSFTGA